MRYLVGGLALVVSVQYLVIAFIIVPRLARLAQAHGRTIAVARWGAAAFFVGCAVTHAGIALTSLAPSSPAAAMGHDLDPGTAAQVVGMVIPHVAQVIGGGLFIGIARSRLEVSIQSKSAAQEQRTIDRQWRSAFDDAPLGIALLPVNGSTHGGDTYVNSAYRTLFGTPTHRGGSDALAGLLPREPDESRRALARLTTGQTVERQLQVETAGRVRLVRATLTPVTDEKGSIRRITGIFEDVTERAEAQAELHASEQLFRRLSEGLGVGVNLRQLDPPEILFANSEYLRIVHLPADELGGAIPSLLARVHPDDQQHFDETYWAPVQRGEGARTEVRLLGHGDEVRWLRVVSNPIAANQIASTVEDITARKVAAAAVLSAKAEAERANLAKSEFLSRMSHELRTPLNAVIGFSQLLKLGSTLTDKQDEAVTHILGGGRHLLGMIDDILDISRIESDQLEVSVEPVLTCEVVEEAVALVRPMSTDHQVTVEVTPPDDGVAGVVRADRRRLRQVLLNLLSNAVKYNRPGGTVRVTCRPYDDAHVGIAVTDDGIGIRPEALARLFTPFDRLGQEATEIEGTGIGLALSQRLAAIMGGRLEVSSEHGVGSTFTVVLQVSAGTGLEGDDGDALLGEAAREPVGRTSTLLYVEDNMPNVRLMQALVERRPGWSMVHAGHGGLGLELATTLRPDLVLLDLHLPDMNGLDVLRRLRADPRTQHLRVVIVSADANRHQIDRLIESGADGYLTKPLDIARAFALLDGHPGAAGESARHTPIS